MAVETFRYDNRIVRDFAIATTVWGIVGMLVGLLIALQLPFPKLNVAEYLTFGRLRPLHTNAVIFAFVGNGMFCGIYYSMQRLLKTRMYSDLLSRINFWGWQLIILSAALTLPLGITSGKEYAELEWPIDIAIAFVWVVFGVNMFGTIFKRREKHMYVAIWFYIASFVAVTILHVVNSLSIPAGLFKSYSVFAGVQDALVQWWYGHNAVAFFLTTPYLGLMYYFLPKAANRPVYSYRLSIIHFWSLVFIYIWAGPHHLLWTAVPQWAQALGVCFSLMLIAPSWGGMLNGLLTLRGAWDRVREDAVLKFMVVAVTAYGMATLEGPLLSIKAINGLAHFTDYIIGHVHLGGLGWNGFLTFGILYWMIPRLYNTQLYSQKLAHIHFWIATIGMIFYVLSMYIAGITQGLMWQDADTDGFLINPNFLDTVIQIVPMYIIRAVGGALYLCGALLMVFNLFKTMRSGTFEPETQASAAALTEKKSKFKRSHRWMESAPVPFLVAVTFAVLLATAMEMIPAFLVEKIAPTRPETRVYTPLELAGRDVYVREGCVNCHSQMIRPFADEKIRYGEPGTAGEYAYDHPFLWGSKRTGPDLHRIGGKYPDAWHYNHFLNPDEISPGSIMPSYPWLLNRKIDPKAVYKRLVAMRKLGVPYSENYVVQSDRILFEQAEAIAQNLQQTVNATVDPYSEMVAIIAYLQSLGVKKIPAGESDD